jgi:hypothetical protein
MGAIVVAAVADRGWMTPCFRSRAALGDRDYTAVEPDR